MELDTARMREYQEFLEDHTSKIETICMEMDEYIQIAAQCMDPESGRGAAQRMMQNIENIRKNIPISDGVSKRLTMGLKGIDEAKNIFGR